jgi:hypothetical protein
MPTTIRDVCRNALLEIGALGQSDQMPDGDAAFTLGKLNRLLDRWNADRQAVFCETFTRYTLVPGTQPTTIGPAASTPTWTVTHRPVSIASLALILPDDIYLPINLRDAQWWAAQTVPALETSIPTDCYYEPSWPLGRLYFWPVPTVAYEVELQTRVLLEAPLVLSDTFSLPQGYEDAITLTLAESLCASFGRPSNADLSRQASHARATIFRNNTASPRLRTQDAGIPSGHGRRADFNYLNGECL